MNYYHPDHEIYTWEYGWIKIVDLYNKYKNNEDITTYQLNLDNFMIEKLDDIEMNHVTVRSCTYRFGNYVGSPVQFNVHPECEVLISIDGGDTLEFMTAKDIHDIHREERVVYFTNLHTVSDLRKGRPPRLFSKCYKVNYRYNNGLSYGIYTNSGAIVTRYDNRYSILGTLM